MRQRLHLQRGAERRHRAPALQPLRDVRAGLAGSRAPTSPSTTASATRSIRRSPTRTTCSPTSSPSAYVAANAPRCANAACTLITLGTGDPLNGIIVAGKNSPFGDAIYAFDKGDIQPRIGVTWDPASNGRTIYRSSYGVYYDQALVGIFEQNSFTNPPFVNTVSILNPRLSNPGSGTTSTTTGVLTLIGNGDDFKTPRTQQWNVGVQQQLYARGAIDVSYVGTHGDHLIRPIDINYPQPADVLRLGSVNLARPYPGLRRRSRCARRRRAATTGAFSRSFRHDAGAAGSLTLNYTLSRNRTDSTNDRDAVDIPQNPLNLAVEYADARTDRRHIFTANYVYELPFFKDSSNAAAEGDPRRLADRRHHDDQLGPADVAHFAKAPTASSAAAVRTSSAIPAPASRRRICTGSTRTPTRRRPTAPTATRCASEFRQPGRNQTDLSLSKNWTFNGTQRSSSAPTLINAFNHTQWLADPNVDGLDNTCTISLTTCNPSNDTFGQILNTRAPREIQLGLKFYW